MVRTVKLNKTMWYILNSKDTDEFISKCVDRISIKNTPRKVNMYKIMRYTKKQFLTIREYIILQN